MRINSPLADGVIGNIAGFASDVSTLAELQTKLAVADMKVAASRAFIPATMVITGILLLMAALPIALIGASELVADALTLTHRGHAYLFVAGVTFMLTLLLVLIGFPRLKTSLNAMAQTREELSRNLAWIKTVLANSGRMPASRRR